VFDTWIYVMLSVRSVLNRYAFIVSQKYDVIKITAENNRISLKY
jgi:hypothetical protein